MCRSSSWVLWVLKPLAAFNSELILKASRFSECSRTPVTVRVPGNESYRGKFQWNCDQGKENLVRVSKEFELFEFELSRFYCFCAVYSHALAEMKLSQPLESIIHLGARVIFRSNYHYLHWLISSYWWNKNHRSTSKQNKNIENRLYK